MRNRPSAEILLVRKDGALILQHRDNKPNIVRPDVVTTFGGTIEEGEAPVEAAYREINEETNLDLKVEALEFFGKYERSIEVDEEENDLYCFVVRDVDDSSLEIYEGQRFEIAKSLEEVEILNSAPFLVRIAKDYFDIHSL